MTDENFSKEVREAIKRIDNKAYTMQKTVEKTGSAIDKDYAEKSIRSDVQKIADLIEVISEDLGQGEALDIDGLFDNEED